MQELVLVVEDEAGAAGLLRAHLSRAGFQVLVATTGKEALHAARENRPQVVVLDLILPEMSGADVCKALKSDPQTQDFGIIILTALSTTEDRVQGLEWGADDYLTKPFSPRELILRIQALLRRMHSGERKEFLEVDAFQIHKGTFEASVEGKPLHLTTTEFKLLALLIERCGETQSRDTLLHDVWGYDHTIDTRTVDIHMRRLREKLGLHAAQLETVRYQGYRFHSLPESRTP